MSSVSDYPSDSLVPQTKRLDPFRILEYPAAIFVINITLFTIIWKTIGVSWLPFGLGEYFQEVFTGGYYPRDMQRNESQYNLLFLVVCFVRDPEEDLLSDANKLLISSAMFIFSLGGPRCQAGIFVTREKYKSNAARDDKYESSNLAMATKIWRENPLIQSSRMSSSDKAKATAILHRFAYLTAKNP